MKVEQSQQDLCVSADRKFEPENPSQQMIPENKHKQRVANKKQVPKVTSTKFTKFFKSGDDFLDDADCFFNAEIAQMSKQKIEPKKSTGPTTKGQRTKKEQDLIKAKRTRKIKPGIDQEDDIDEPQPSQSNKHFKSSNDLIRSKNGQNTNKKPARQSKMQN